MFIKKYIVLLVAVLFTATNVYASDLKVYPIEGFFTGFQLYEENPDFERMSGLYKDKIIEEYKKEFKHYFPNAVNKFDNVSKDKTFAAYITVPRAGRYNVPRLQGKLLDVYYPVTLCINFMNVSTGEILYSNRITTANAKMEFDAQTPKQVQSKELIKAYKESIDILMPELLQQARQEFKPFELSTKIIDKYKTAYILDKGQASGIATNSFFTNKNGRIKVIYSDLDYAVAIQNYGSTKMRDTYSKFSNTQPDSISKIKKPKMLFLNDFNDDKLYTFFTSALGEDAKFSLVTLDDSFRQSLNVLVGKNSTELDDTIRDEISAVPDYILKLYFTKPINAVYKTKHSYEDNDKYGIMAGAVVFDKSGKVVYAKCENYEKSDIVKVNYRLNENDRIEETRKNVLVPLANEVKNNIQFNDVVFNIKNVDKTEANHYNIYLQDKNKLLKKGSKITLFKKIQTEINKKEICVPIWECVCERSVKGVAVCKTLKPYIDKSIAPSSFDIAKKSIVVSKPSKTDTLFNYISDVVELEGNEVSLDKSDYETIAFIALASGMKSPLAVPNKEYTQLGNLTGRGFENNVEISRNSNNLSIRPTYQIIQKSETYKDNGRIIDRQYEVTVNITAIKQDKVVKELSAKKTVIVSIPSKNNEDILKYELLKNIYPLIQQLASKF